MKLALFHSAFETVGGAEILVAEQAKLFSRAGLEVRLVTFAYNPEQWASRLEGLPVQCIPKRRLLDFLHGVTRLAKLKARGARAAQAFKGEDVVVAHNFPCNALLGMAQTEARRIWQCNEPSRSLHMREANPRMTSRLATNPGDFCEAILEFKELLEKYDRDLAKRRPLHARKSFDLENCSQLDEIYAISEFSRDNARTIYGRCREEVVYPIVRFPEGGRTRTGLDRSGLKILVHGRLGIFKNIDTVIRGFAHFAARHPGAHLHVVGEGPQRASLERLGAQAAPGAVTFHGFLPVDRLREVYEACDVFALLTLDEPFGMVFPEAAAKGLLLVGPDHGGPLEILDGGRLGRVCDPFEPEALAAHLDAIWRMPDSEVDHLRVKADQACRERYSEARVRPQLLKMLEWED